MRMNIEDQQALARWAADCAERVLGLFERQSPGDVRPRAAVAAARAWADGEITVGAARQAALAAHAAARHTADPAAKAAARAAGHAAATAHVAGHAAHAATYSATAASVAEVTDVTAAATERRWQRQQVPENLVRVAFPV